MTTSRLHAIATKLPAPLRSVARSIWSAARVWIERRRYRFSYSQEFYEQGYHDKLASVGGDSLDFWTAEGYRDRLMAVCDSLDRHVRFGPGTRHLEVACMYGKTAFWIAERYPHLSVWAFDFSQRFVDATRAANPIGDRLTLWRGDVTNIHCGESRFDRFFDFATCLDVTEHLPDDVYRKMLSELARVIRAGGHLLLMQGNTVQVEHIHVLPEQQLVQDAEAVGFELIETLPERHHLFRRLDRPRVRTMS